MPDKDSPFHPHYNTQAYSQYAAKIMHLEDIGDKIALYPPQVRGKAQRKHERMLDKQFGSVTSEDYDYRLRLFRLWHGVHGYWHEDGRRITDVSTVFDDLDNQRSKTKIFLPAFTGCPTAYIHFGHNERLALKKFEGTIEGVYVRPPREKKGNELLGVTIPGFTFSFPMEEDGPLDKPMLAAVCRRGGKLLPNASLEKLILNQSSTVFSCVDDNRLNVIAGDKDMTADPAVELAMEVAVEAYMMTIHHLFISQNRAA